MTIFNLLYSGQIVENIRGDVLNDSQFFGLWLDPRSQLSKDLLHSFQSLFLSVVKRITDSGEEKKVGVPGLSDSGFKLSRAMSKVDVSTTSLLIKSAFNLIFR